MEGAGRRERIEMINSVLMNAKEFIGGTVEA
jgi:hypothetical protein